MVKLLVITSDSSLVGGLSAALELDGFEFESADGWQAGRDRLVKQDFPGVLVDLQSTELPGFQAFVQLDDLLQKSDASAILLLRGEGGEMAAMADDLDAFVGTVDLATDRAAALQDLVDPIVERAGAAEAQSEQVESVEVSLPTLDSGDLATTSLPRLVHAVEAHDATGRLRLAHQDLVRDFPFQQGRLLKSGDTPVDKLQAAMAWTSGEWDFQQTDVGDGQPVGTLPLLLEGAYNHVDQRRAMGALTSEMSQYVARAANAGHHLDLIEQDGSLEAFLNACDGETPLEEVLSQLGSNTVRAFKAAYVAVETDLVVLRDEEGPEKVEVVWEFEDREAAGRERSARPSREGVEAYSEPETADREDSLRQMWDRIKEASAYEVFDLWEGCGEREVKDRYYELVKDHHPDAYGGNISDEGKELAEKIFVRIKEAFSELQRREDEQLVSRQEARQRSEAESELAGGDFQDQTAGESGPTAMSGRATGATGVSGEDSEPGMARETSVTEEEGLTTDSFSATEKSSPGEEESLSDRLSMEEETSSAEDGDADRLEKLQRLKKRRQEAADTIPPSEGGSAASSAETVGGTESSSGSTTESDAGFEDTVRTSEAETIPPPDGDSDGSRVSSLSGGEQQEASDVADGLEPAESKDEAQEYFNEGYQAFKEDDEERAFKYFEKAHEFDESNGLYKTFYGYLLFLVDPDERRRAHSLLKEAIDTENRQALPDAHLFIGRLYKVEEKHERAKRHFKQSLQLNPESIEAKRELRVYNLRGEDSDESEGDGGLFDGILDKELF